MAWLDQGQKHPCSLSLLPLPFQQPNAQVAQEQGVGGGGPQTHARAHVQASVVLINNSYLI